MSGYHRNFERKTMWVVILTAITMVVEISFGLTTKSMALLADGIHMGTHVFAIGLSWIAYVFVRKYAAESSSNDRSNKILALSGYTSGLMLLFFALVIVVETVKRMIGPVPIIYRDAIIVACIGLAVNIASAFLLHHHHEESDVNIRAAYLHVLADALTSVSAIIGLTAAMIWDIPFIDTIAAIISSAVIIKWSVNLLKDSGSILLNLKEGKSHGAHS